MAPDEMAQNNPFLLSASRPPLVIAHRGGAGLKPENTMNAFTQAACMGCDMLEIDVRLTADGRLVAHHDAAIDRMSEGSGEVAKMTYQQLREFNFAYNFENIPGEEIASAREINVSAANKASITLLQEVMEKLPDILLTVEIKDEGDLGRKAVDRLMKLNQKFSHTDKLIVGSFHDEVLSYLRSRYSADINISASKKVVAKFVVSNLFKLDRLLNFNIEALQIPNYYHGFKLARPALIKAAHRKNIAVHFWTINEREEMKRLIDLNVDGIMTDRPDILLDIIN